jgi:hypothetical protein
MENNKKNILFLFIILVDQAEEATVAAVVMRTPDYDKLLEYGLDQRVAEKLDEIYKVLTAVWRIRDVYPGSDFFQSRITDSNCLHPGSRILIKEFRYFNPKKKQKKGFLSSKKYDPGCSSRIRMLTSSHPGSRIQGSKRHQSRIPDPDPQH